MPPAAVIKPEPDLRSKPPFVNRVRAFANRARTLPGGRITAVVSAAAILFASVSGAFGTGDMAPARRLLFWTLLIGLNMLLWRCWFAWRVRGAKDWWQAAALGAVVLNLPLPLEVTALLRAVGGKLGTGWPMIWVYAAILSAALVPVIALALPRRAPPGQEFAKSALWRAGARAAGDVCAICAEDHYCRVVLANGREALVHARFSALVAELSGADGLVVRRGHWVAAQAVETVERTDRRWIVNAVSRQIPVASSCVPDLRRRGWI